MTSETTYYHQLPGVREDSSVNSVKGEEAGQMNEQKSRKLLQMQQSKE